MGRKPNALITEFFVRGRKLQDSSNRYHMTCRACHQEVNTRYQARGSLTLLTMYCVMSIVS